MISRGFADSTIITRGYGREGTVRFIVEVGSILYNVDWQEVIHQAFVASQAGALIDTTQTIHGELV